MGGLIQNHAIPSERAQSERARQDIASDANVDADSANGRLVRL